MRCNKCDSEDIIRNGFNYSGDHRTQKYRCLTCRNIFSHSEKLPRHDASSEMVSLCIDLYLKGLSYRVIQQQVFEQFRIKISQVSVYHWIQEFGEEIERYLQTMKLNTSAVWQMDETFIPFKGLMFADREGKKNRTIGCWLWVCIDTLTRYVVSAKLTLDKTSRSGRQFFEEMKKYQVNTPKVICTDGNNSYEYLIKEYYPNAIHIPIKKINLKPNTSFIERFNGTIKNRTKTMRGFNAFESCEKTLKLFVIYYNYLRPHMSLEQKTPAEEAGLNLELPNRWISLIKRARVANNFK